jgi:hypothetical protein
MPHASISVRALLDLLLGTIQEAEMLYVELHIPTLFRPICERSEKNKGKGRSFGDSSFPQGVSSLG